MAGGGGGVELAEDGQALVGLRRGGEAQVLGEFDRLVPAQDEARDAAPSGADRHLGEVVADDDVGRRDDRRGGGGARSGGVDGWVSLEVSPTLAYDAGKTLESAMALHARAGRPNLFIKIPGTPQGLPAIWAIGDAVAPRGFWAATSDGNRVAREI